MSGDGISRELHTFSMLTKSFAMKAMLLLVCSGIIVLTLSHTKPRTPVDKALAVSGIQSPDFKTIIQPILQKNCSPCHFPGGKMYEKMPFDKGETIINHAAGALKRFKDKEESDLVRQFIEANKVK